MFVNNNKHLQLIKECVSPSISNSVVGMDLKLHVLGFDGPNMHSSVNIMPSLYPLHFNFYFVVILMLFGDTLQPFQLLQVKYNRLELLQHPLMTLYIARKWWKEVFPVFIIYIIFYAVFLVFLTSFALHVPRPSPGDEFCKHIILFFSP